MTDFPNLNMSIGEYYKLLMEGKRPMRNRNPASGPEPNKQAHSSTSLPHVAKPKKPDSSKDNKVSENSA